MYKVTTAITAFLSIAALFFFVGVMSSSADEDEREGRRGLRRERHELSREVEELHRHFRNLHEELEGLEDDDEAAREIQREIKKVQRHLHELAEDRKHREGRRDRERERPEGRPHRERDIEEAQRRLESVHHAAEILEAAGLEEFVREPEHRARDMEREIRL